MGHMLCQKRRTRHLSVTGSDTYHNQDNIFSIHVILDSPFPTRKLNFKENHINLV